MSAYDTTRFTGTVFNEVLAPHTKSGIWISWGPYHIVDYYTSVIDETRAIRTGAALEDKTPLTKTFINGPDAERFINFMTVRDTSKMETGQANYTLWCDHNGHVITEGILFRLSEDKFCYTAASIEEWCKDHANGYDVEIEEEKPGSPSFGIFCVQGPKSPDVIKAITGNDLVDIKFSRSRKIEIAGSEIIIWRQGFTGEVGFECWIPAESAVAVTKVFVEKGLSNGATLIGNAAQDVGRVEAGMLIISTDYRPGGKFKPHQVINLADDEFLHTPAELNFGRLVNLNKPIDFIGKKALQKEARAGQGKAMLGLEINWQDIEKMYARQGIPSLISSKVLRTPSDLYEKGGDKIGFATSVTWSPNLNNMIGFAHIRTEYAEVGKQVELMWNVLGEKDRVNARTLPLPFVPFHRSGNLSDLERTGCCSDIPFSNEKTQKLSR